MLLLEYWILLEFIGSLLAYLIVRDLMFGVFIKLKLGPMANLWLRSNLSTMASQTIDTAIYNCCLVGVVVAND